MRTTITIADDAASVARHYAEKHDVTLGQAVTVLIRQAHAASKERKKDLPEWLKPLPSNPDSPIVTLEFVNELLDEME